MSRYQTWAARALCAQRSDLDLFFPASKDEKGIQAAKAVCARCEVSIECAMYAIQLESSVPGLSRQGIWGGLTPEERAAMSDATRTAIVAGRTA